MIAQQIQQLYKYMFAGWELKHPSLWQAVKNRIFHEYTVHLVGPAHEYTTHPGIPFRQECRVWLPIRDPNVARGLELKYLNKWQNWKPVTLWADFKDGWKSK